MIKPLKISKPVCLLVLMVLVCIYLFRIMFAERVEYGRYSVEYYLRIPAPIRSLDEIIYSDSQNYISVLSDGPSPAMTTAVYRGVNNMNDVIKNCVLKLKSQSVIVIPKEMSVMEEPASKLKAWIDVSRHSPDSGDITITLLENES